MVATRKYTGLESVKLMVIQPVRANGQPQGEPLIAADATQSGPGELVAWVKGREAALSLPETYVPVDCAIIGTVDHAWSGRTAPEPWRPIMILCRVIGNAVASVKHPCFEGKSILVLQPVEVDGNTPKGGEFFVCG